MARLHKSKNPFPFLFVRKPLTWILCAVALLWAIIFFGPLGAMKTADGFSLSSFRKLRAGDSFERVIDSLGYPLSYMAVAPPDKNGNYFPTMTNMQNLASFCRSTNNYMTILQYSSPRYGKDFYMFEVIVQSNAVLEARHYFYYAP